VKKGFIIAIDGPLASGKGTIAKNLARVLHGVDLYTGAMYRCLALYCINSGINLENATDVASQLNNITVLYKDERILLNNTDVTDAIQELAIAEGASVIAVIPEVRKELVRRQQEIGNKAMLAGKIVIVEGRDIGTVVFPNAEVKIYLTASEEVRVKRRLVQYRRQKDTPTFEEVLKQISKRDKRDSERVASPMTKDPEKNGYYVMDNSAMNTDETIESILAELKRRKLVDD